MLAENDNQLLTAQEVAKLLRISIMTLKRWSNSGLLPQAIRIKNHRLYSREDIDKFLQEHVEAVKA